MPHKAEARTSTTQHQQSQATEEQDLTFLLSSLRDPHNPLHCGTCIDGAFIECTVNERRALRKKCRSNLKYTNRTQCVPELWNAIVGFLFHTRTAKQMASLVNRMADCRCCMSGNYGRIEEYHQTALRESQERPVFVETATEERHPELRLYTSARCAWVTDMFFMLSSVVVDTRIKAMAKGSSTTWPFSLSNLLPFGVDRLVQSALQWHSHVPEPLIFHFMASVINACQMLIIPSLIKYQFTATVVQSTREMVDRAMIDISHLGGPTSIQVSRGRLSLHAASTVMYFRGLNIHAYPDLIRGYEAKAFQLFSMILYLAKEWETICGTTIDSGLLVNIDLCISTAEQLYRVCHLNLSPLPPFPVHPLLLQSQMRGFVVSWIWEEYEDRNSTVTTIWMYRRSQSCSAQGCTNSLQHVGQLFQRCGGCKVVSYCGLECQRNAWKHEHYPHKHVCAALKNLVEKGGGYSLFFSADMRNLANSKNSTIRHKILQNWKTAIIDSDVLLVEDWANTIRIVSPTTEWTPGYEDYEEIIARLSENGRGLKPMYLNRDIQWPADVEGDKRLLKIQPFWGQDLGF